MKQKQIFTFRDAEKQVAPAAFSIMLKPAGSACNLDCLCALHMLFIV